MFLYSIARIDNCIRLVLRKLSYTWWYSLVVFLQRNCSKEPKWKCLLKKISNSSVALEWTVNYMPIAQLNTTTNQFNGQPNFYLLITNLKLRLVLSDRNACTWLDNNKKQTTSQTSSMLRTTVPSGVNAGAGNVIQSMSSQVSRDQSADQMLTRRSLLTASQSWEPGTSSAFAPCVVNTF